MALWFMFNEPFYYHKLSRKNTIFLFYSFMKLTKLNDANHICGI